MFRLKYSALYLLLILGFLGACKERDEAEPAPAGTNPAINSLVYEVMKKYYLWYEQLPATFNANQHPTPDDALEALKYKPQDRWSYIEDLQSYIAYFKGGQYVGNGFGMKLDASNNLWVSYVYPGSPAGQAGLARGYRINRINGQEVGGLLASNTINNAFGEDKAGVQTRFGVTAPDGSTKEITLVKEPVTISSVLYRDVKQVGDKKVGYLVFTTFIDKSTAELNEAFTYFKGQGVQELVLDLRYNGGGSLAVARHLASLIAPGRAGQKFVELTYNAKNQNENVPFNFVSVENGLNLNRLFVITTRSSASASEAIINGLKPYMPVITVGAASHGKPVGMNTFLFDKQGKQLKFDDAVNGNLEGYALLPIMFKVANASGQADYFNGIPADGIAADDVAKVFGDVQEDSLEQALYYIQNGTFSGTIAATGRRATDERPVATGFRAEIGAY